VTAVIANPPVGLCGVKGCKGWLVNTEDFRPRNLISTPRTPGRPYTITVHERLLMTYP
jgi:hypothetical protein